MVNDRLAGLLLRAVLLPGLLPGFIVVGSLHAASGAPGRAVGAVSACGEWLERAEREVEERPADVVRAMGLRDGDVLAEVSSGTGYFARRLARAVAPSGRVYAEDSRPEMLARLAKEAAKEGITNIVTVLGSNVDPKLPRQGLRWVLIADVCHEVPRPPELLARIRESLAPGGRIALLEYRLEGDSAANVALERRMSVDQVLAEWNQSGFELVQRIESLPSQHLFIFTTRRGARAFPN
jgi:predicted methyltransferase